MPLTDIISWPFALAVGSTMLIIKVLVLFFWIWMIIDCAKRNFKNSTEKIIWIIVVVLLGWLGALAYFIVIKSINPKGISK